MEQVFKDNPNLDVCYQTADGKCFFLESDAVNHGKGLKDKKVKKLERLESQEPRTENQESAKGTDEMPTKVKELETLELIPKNYMKMKSLANYFGLEVEGNKADDFIKALENYKKELE